MHVRRAQPQYNGGWGAPVDPTPSLASLMRSGPCAFDPAASAQPRGPRQPHAYSTKPAASPATPDPLPAHTHRPGLTMDPVRGPSWALVRCQSQARWNRCGWGGCGGVGGAFTSTTVTALRFTCICFCAMKKTKQKIMCHLLSSGFQMPN